MSYRTTYPIAKAQYTCALTKRTIQKGEAYTYVSLYGPLYLTSTRERYVGLKFKLDVKEEDIYYYIKKCYPVYVDGYTMDEKEKSYQELKRDLHIEKEKNHKLTLYNKRIKDFILLLLEKE